MLFSGKITNSFLIFLTRQGADLDSSWDFTEVPSELLRDPSSWIEAESVEKFLQVLDGEFGQQQTRESLMAAVGHQCNELRAWGALDSVLKMIQTPQDIYSHPHRFLSYFVSPAPPIANLQRTDAEVSFDVPILTQEYPYVTEYLRAAFEALPKYLGDPSAHVVWEKTRLTISWTNQQPSFLGKDDLQTNVRPEFVDSLVHSLEASQRDLEEEKRRNFELQKKLDELKAQSLKALETNATAIAPPIEDLESVETGLLKMRDYFSRAHQLITLLVRQDRMDVQVREAMRRVDWEVVGLQFPNTFSEALGSVRKLKKQTQAEASPQLDLSPLDINEVVEEALKALQEEEGTLKVDRAFFMDRPVKVNRLKLREALAKVFKKMQEDPGGEKGAWTVITRPKGKRAEIEISRSANHEIENLGFTPDWSELEKQITSNKWLLDVSHSPDVGSSFRLQIPVQ